MELTTIENHTIDDQKNPIQKVEASAINDKNGYVANPYAAGGTVKVSFTAPINKNSISEETINLVDENGNVMNPQTPTKQFSHFLAKHNIRHLKFHCLRHTSATILLTNGCDIKTVSARLGHSSIETTNIYVHMLESVDRQSTIAFETLI